MDGLLRYGGLATAIALGLCLRFWNLDLKPLWLDETITLLFALGRRYNDIPQETLLPLTHLLQTLTWQPQSCGMIAQTISQQSTHPPLFFCLMHQWMGYLQGSDHSLRWQVRSLAALFGAGAIALLYILNRVAFSHRAGLWAAALMAVSPFAVYLSQEARHYTLPMLIIAASLIPLVQLCAIAPPRRPFLAWSAWIGLNSLGFYVHYFCILAFVAQVVTFLIIFLPRRRSVVGVAIASGGVILSIMPWLSTLLDHTQRPETDWLKFDATLGLHWLEPILRLLGGGIVTVMLLPVEAQPLPVVIVSGLLMLGFMGYLGRSLWQYRQRLFPEPKTQRSAQVLGSFLVVVVSEYLLLVYGLHKDLTLAFRYNFILYPALCALLGASLWAISQQASHHSKAQFLPWAVLVVGLISSGGVVTDAAFAKPFMPKLTAQMLLTQRSSPPLVILKHTKDSQDVALGLSTALAVDQYQSTVPNPPTAVTWGFTSSTDSTQNLLELNGDILDKTRSPLPNPSFTLWRIGGLKMSKPPMPEQLILKLSQRSAPATTARCVAPQLPTVETRIVYQHYECSAS